MKKYKPKIPQGHRSIGESGDIQEGVFIRFVDPVTGARILVREGEQEQPKPPTVPVKKNQPMGACEATLGTHKILEFQIPLGKWNTAHLAKTFLKLWQTIRPQVIPVLSQPLKDLDSELRNRLDEAFSRGDDKAALRELRKIQRRAGKLQVQPVNSFCERKRRVVDNTKEFKLLKKEYLRYRKEWPNDSHGSLCQMVKERLGKLSSYSSARSLERILRPLKRQRCPRRIP